MRDQDKTKERLLGELVELRQRVAELEALETERKRTEEALQKAHDRLEQRVEERMAELSQVNAALRDEIAQRKLTEVGLRRRERQLTEAQRIARLGHWEWDIAQDTAIWSDELYRIFGAEPEQFDSNAYEAFLNCLHPEDRERMAGVIEKALNDQAPFSVEHRIVRPDGTVRNIHAQGEIVCDKAGRPTTMVGTSQDITERKRAEEALNETRARLQHVLATSPAVIYSCQVDPDGRPEDGYLPTFVSENIAELFGYETGECLGDPRWWPEHIHPEDAARALDEMAAVFEQGYLAHEYRFRHKDGSYRWVHDQLILVRDTTGGPVEFVGSWMDITERMQAEKALQKSEGRYRTLFEGVPVGLYRTTPEGQVLDVNLALIEMLGYPDRQTLVAHNVTDGYVNTGERQRWQSLIEREGQLRGFEVQWRRYDGELIWVRESARAIRDADGRVLYYEGIVEDITERKQAEEALRESEKRFRNLYENAPNAYFSVGVDGLIQRCNKGAGELLGYAVEEMVGRPVFELYADTPQGKEKAAQVFQRFQASETITDEELQMQRADGTTVWISLTVNAVRDPHGQVTESRSMVVDITERKRAEEALRESEARLREVVEHMPVLFDAFDENGKALFWNKECERVTGYSADEIVDNPKSLELICPDSEYRAWVLEQLEELGNYYRDWELDVQCKNGETRTIAWSSISRDHPIPGWWSWGIGVDVTERKQAEEGQRLALAEALQATHALRDSRHMLQTVLDSIPAAVFWKDRDSIYLGGNRTWLEAAGLESSEEVVGKSDYDLPWEKEQADSFREDDRRVMESGIPEYDIIEPYLRADGTHAWAKTNKVPLRDTEGNVVGVLGTYEDITERRRAEEALRSSEEKFSKAFHSSPSIMAISTLEDGHYMDVNESFSRVIGHSRKEVIGRTSTELRIFANPEDRGRLVQMLEEQGSLRNIEAGVRTKAGEVRIGLFGAELVEIEGEQCLLTVMDDITERKQAEEALRRRSEELALLNRVSQTFSSTLDLDQVLATVLEEVRRLMEVIACSIWLIDPETGELVCRQATGPKSETVLDWRLGPGEGIAGWVARNGESLIVPDARADERHFRGVDPQDELGLRSILSIPLQASARARDELSRVGSARGVKQDVIGVLQVVDTEIDRFDAGDLALLEPLAASAAIAIENARLYKQAEQEIAERKRAEEALRRRAAHQEALTAVITAAATAPNLQNLLESALDHTLKALGLGMGAIWVNGARAMRNLPPDIHRVFNQVAQQAGLGVSKLYVIEDWQAETTESSQVTIAPVAAHLGIRASLTAPVSVEGRRIGGLSLAAPEPRTWSSEEIALVEAIGRQLGGAAERLHLLDKTREQAQQVQQIMDTVPEGVLLLDTDGHVILANPLGEKNLVVLANAKVGDAITHLGNRPLAELLTSPPKGLWHEVTSNGRIFEVIARPLETGPMPGGWVLVSRDVTQEREVQQRIQQQERLAAVGQLAAGIAHDFNNIMAVIALYARMSLRSSDLPANMVERMEVIDQQAWRASELIQQILDFSRRTELERSPMDLLVFLKEQVKLLERTLPESIRIDLAYEEGDYIVNADPTRMQQAIMNLATNARDAMPKGGRLHIGLEQIEIKPGESPPLPEMEAVRAAAGEIENRVWVRVTVADTGPGIPPDVLPHIFDPFFTTKAPDLGTGLGLAQVYGIVKSHEGHVDVKTSVGEGTTFILYLPALPTHQPNAQTPRMGHLAQGQGQAILVVEDDAATRKALVDSLKMLDYQVLEATDGQEALTIFEQHADQIALVLSDVVMPQMGGQALFQALRERDSTVKVVLLTGHPMTKELKELHAQGLSGWLLKPPTVEQLAQVVAQALEEG